MDTTPYKNFRSTFVAYSCIQDGFVGKICRFPTSRNTLLIPVITRFTAFVMVPGIRVGGIKQSCVSDVCLSVAFVVSNSRTQRPWKTKIGTEVTHVTCDSCNSFEVKRSPHSLLEFIHSFFHSYRNGFTWQCKVNFKDTLQCQKS